MRAARFMSSDEEVDTSGGGRKSASAHNRATWSIGCNAALQPYTGCDDWGCSRLLAGQICSIEPTAGGQQRPHSPKHTRFHPQGKHTRRRGPLGKSLKSPRQRSDVKLGSRWKPDRRQNQRSWRRLLRDGAEHTTSMTTPSSPVERDSSRSQTRPNSSTTVELAPTKNDQWSVRSDKRRSERLGSKRCRQRRHPTPTTFLGDCYRRHPPPNTAASEDLKCGLLAPGASHLRAYPLSHPLLESAGYQ